MTAVTRGETGPPQRSARPAPDGPAGEHPVAGAAERRRALAELLLERYGIVTREQVLAEGIRGGFALLYDTFCNLETLGVCRRGYFIEGMGGAQFALPGAVERLRALGGAELAPSAAGPGVEQRGRALVLAAADPAQPFGAALPWPRREGQERRPSRVAGAYVVMVAEEPVLYLERGGRGLVTLVDPQARPAAGAASSKGIRSSASFWRSVETPIQTLRRGSFRCVER